MTQEQTAHQISTLNESPLHAALKAWYAQPGDRLEVEVEGFIIDIVRDELLIEIQTGNLSSLKRKLPSLADGHPVRLVVPIPREKWIVRLAEDGRGTLGRRRSPKRGQIEDVFGELVSLPRLLAHPNFSLEVLLTQEEELRRYDGTRAWRRRGWVTHERRLLEVAYRRAVRPEGNPDARRLIERVFTPADADWRGLGRLPASGLVFAGEFSAFDAAARLGLETREAPEPAGCRCAQVLLGSEAPRGCPLFGNRCTPESPVGPCMVSSEGSCAAEYRYGREKES